MSLAEILLIGVAVGFAALVVWVYWPSRRDRLQAYGRMPLEDDEDSTEREG